MPKVACWMIRTALIYLLIGSLMGAMLFVHKAVRLWSELWSWRPAHVEMMLIGWLVQCVMGVAYWMMPRVENTHAPRGNPCLFWGVWSLLNLGIVISIIGTTFLGKYAGVGRFCEAIAVVGYLWGMRRRMTLLSPSEQFPKNTC